MAPRRRNDKVTMSDIAKKVGVTQATVSHVMNGTAKISAEVTEKVLRYANDMGYKPKLKVAGNIKAKSVGLLIPDVENSFYSEIAKGVEIVMRRHGYLTFQCNTLYRTEYERMYLHTLNQYNVHGIIIGYPMPDDYCADFLRANDMPAVFLDSDPETCRNFAPSVRVDNILGGRLAAEHLNKLGAKKVCVASEPLLNLPLRERLQGFLDFMKEIGACVDDSRIYLETSQYSKIDMGYNIGAKILIDGEVDAIFATSDYVAFGVMKRLKENGVRVPEDVKVIGYDDVGLAQMIDPPLTTIAQPVGEMTQKGAELLYERIKNKGNVQHLLMEPCLIVRGSTMQYEKNGLK